MLRKRQSKKRQAPRRKSKKRQTPKRKAKKIHFERIPLEVVKKIGQRDVPTGEEA